MVERQPFIDEVATDNAMNSLSDFGSRAELCTDETYVKLLASIGKATDSAFHELMKQVLDPVLRNIKSTDGKLGLF